MASEAVFKDIPPFPEDVPTALISTISFKHLRQEDDQVEKDVLKSCNEVGFFLLDLREDEIGTRLIDEIDQLFLICQETMNLPDNIKEQHQNDIPKSFLG